jgi:carbon-monoxide dehydrogenase medium subunit
MLPPFEIHQPSTVDAAVVLRERFGESAALYAGGSELILAMKEGLGTFAHLIDVKSIPALRELGLAADGRGVVVGAAVTHRRLEHSALMSERLPLLVEAERQVGNVRVRSMGTLGGNLSFAEPHSDPPTALLALGATLTLQGARGARRLAVRDFLVGPYETALGGDEVLVKIEIPPLPPRAATAYLKFGIHERPTVGVAVLLVPDASRRRVAQARVCVGCVGPVPARLDELEARLAGVFLSALEAGGREAERAGEGLDAVSDLHGSADYKRAMAGVFVKRALALAARRAQAAAA